MSEPRFYISAAGYMCKKRHEGAFDRLDEHEIVAALNEREAELAELRAENERLRTASAQWQRLAEELRDINMSHQAAMHKEGRCEEALTALLPMVEEDFANGPDGNSCASEPYREAYRLQLAALGAEPRIVENPYADDD